MDEIDTIDCSCAFCEKKLCAVSESEVKCATDTDGKVFTEIQWGEDIRLNKIQEKRYEYVTKYSSSAKRRHLKKKKKGPELLCKCGKKMLMENVPEKKVIDRGTLNHQEHIELLAQPKALPMIQETICKARVKRNKIRPPRYIQLSIPLGRRMLYTWKDFQYQLTPEQITSLKTLMKKRDALTTHEANKYFKLLTSQRKKNMKKLKSSNKKLICQGRLKSKKDIDKIVDAIMAHFLKTPLAEVKDRHIIISNELIQKLVDKNLAKQLKRSNRDIYSKTLYQTIDQMSIWIDDKIDQVDTAEIDEKTLDQLSISTSGTDTSCTDSMLICSDEALRDAKQAQRELEAARRAEEGEEAEEAESILPLSEEEEVYAEEEEEGFIGWGAIKGKEAPPESIYGEESLMEEEMEGLQLEAEEEIGLGEEAEGLLEGEGEGLEGLGEEGEGEEGALGEAEGEAAAAAGEGEGEFEGGEEGEAAVGEAGEVGEAGGEEELGEGEGEEAGLSMMGEEGEGLLKEMEAEIEEMMGEEIKSAAIVEAEGKKSVTSYLEGEERLTGAIKRIAKPTSVKEHSPDMICCLTLKLWASWLMEVAHNSHGWCKWITEVIGQIRLFAAILRGEVKNDDGTVRILYKEEWDNFKIQLENDIIGFRQYNMHVKDLSDNIIAKFTGKEVACCPACLESRLILSVDQGHEVIEQLTEAIKTSEYWRRWLDNLVEQAKQITSLDIQKLPGAPGPVSVETIITAPSAETSIYEMLELNQRSTTSTLSSGFYIIEEVNDDESDDK